MSDAGVAIDGVLRERRRCLRILNEELRCVRENIAYYERLKMWDDHNRYSTAETSLTEMSAKIRKPGNKGQPWPRPKAEKEKARG